MIDRTLGFLNSKRGDEFSMRMLPTGLAAKNKSLTVRTSILFAVFLGSSFFWEPQVSANNSFDHDLRDPSEYYTIDESQDVQPSHVDVAETLDTVAVEPFSFKAMVAKAREFTLSLLNWTLHPDAPSSPPEKYSRRAHFGRWINDPTDESCFNTRAKVLLRDAEGPISYRENNHCIVDKGAWSDSYTGRKFIESRDIQIDHMVPLKNAYDSGAWEWDFQARCLYANYMGTKFHLISSNGIENMRKGDRAPDGYVPPNLSYRCEYIENWLKIKLIWRLNLSPSEVAAIRQLVKDNGCNPSNFTLSDSELRKQRSNIRNNLGLCSSLQNNNR